MRTHLILLLPVVLLTVSCSKKDNDSATLGTLIPPVPVTAVPVPKFTKSAEPPAYIYPYGERRDPFVPLTGKGGVMASRSGTQGGVEEGIVDNLQLKGIMRDGKGKIALISSAKGESYTLRSGRIFDKKNRMLQGVSGIIKENSIVLVTQNRTIKEISLTQ